MWSLSRDEATTLEWSTDGAVLGYVSSTAHYHLLSEFRSVLLSYRAVEFIGPCIVKRYFFRKHSQPATTVWIERCDASRRTNTLRFEDAASLSGKRLIRTTWVALPVSQSNCLPDCIPAACIPVTACVVDANGHSSQTGHTAGTHSYVHGTSSEPSIGDKTK